jgi:hypothetical protein
MRKIFSICILVLFTISATGQSKKPLIYSDALARDKKMQISGAVLTVIGGVTFFAGNIMYRNAYSRDSNPDREEEDAARSVHVMLGGLGIMAVGIPLFAIGKKNERSIRIQARLVNFKGSAPITGIGLKIRF